MSKALMAAASLYNDQRFLSKSEIRIYKNKIRRRKIAMMQRLALAITLTAILFLIIFIASSIVIDAQSEDYRPEYKYYKVLTVHSGDTIWDIAAENVSYEHYDGINDYVTEICEINNILGEKVNAGEDIVIPYFSTEFK